MSYVYDACSFPFLHTRNAFSIDECPAQMSPLAHSCFPPKKSHSLKYMDHGADWKRINPTHFLELSSPHQFPLLLSSFKTKRELTNVQKPQEEYDMISPSSSFHQTQSLPSTCPERQDFPHSDGLYLLSGPQTHDPPSDDWENRTSENISLSFHVALPKGC